MLEKDLPFICSIVFKPIPRDVESKPRLLPDGFYYYKKSLFDFNQKKLLQYPVEAAHVINN